MSEVGLERDEISRGQEDEGGHPENGEWQMWSRRPHTPGDAPQAHRSGSRAG